MSLEIDVRKTVGDFTLNVRISHQSGVTGILGASGSGKSLTLQMIAGVVRPDEGRIVLNGRVLFDSAARIDLPPQARRIGYLFQNYALFPNMTVARNISCGIPRGTERRERKKLVGAWVDNMRLQGLEKHRPGQLSGGQQQRTALARVLIGTPEILMLDEPFSALDSYLREQLVTELKTLLESVDTDAVLVSHSRDEVYELCDTLAVMRDGCVVTAGTVKSVFSDPKTTTAALLTGCKNVVAARPVEDRKMLVPPWGITLTCASPVRPDVDAVGIRAHYFAPDIPSNSYPVQIVQTIEEPFALIHKFRYLSQEATVPPVWWRVSRDRNASVRFPKMLGIAPEDVFLLRDDAGMCRRSGTENPWWSDASANLF